MSKTTSPDDCGTISNEVTVGASNEPDNDQFPNTDGADIVVNCPDLEVVKSGNGPLSAGQIATFTITVTNHGPGTAYDVTLTDQLPSGTWSLGGANAADCAHQRQQPAQLRLRRSRRRRLSDHHRQQDDRRRRLRHDPQRRHRRGVQRGHRDRPVPEQRRRRHRRQLPRCDRHQDRQRHDQRRSARDVRHRGHQPRAGHGVRRDPQRPAAGWHLDARRRRCARDCSISASNLLTCDFGDLANGASRTISLSRETTAEDCGELPNTATVSASNEAEEDTDNNDSSDTITVDCPLIVITKTADDPIVDAGDQIGFVVTVTNTGDGSAFNVTVTDVLPVIAGLSWSIESQSPAGSWSIVAGTLTVRPGHAGLRRERLRPHHQHHYVRHLRRRPERRVRRLRRRQRL